MVGHTPHGWAAAQGCCPKEGTRGPNNGHMSGHPTNRDTSTGWPRHCLPKSLREQLKRHLT